MLNNSDLTKQGVTKKMNIEWQPIETAPVNQKKMFVVIGIKVRNGTYTTDPYCVWSENGKFIRWPHDISPTHWCELPDA